MDDSQGPMFSLLPSTAKVLNRVRTMIGSPGDRDFAPQLRVIGPRLLKKIGSGELDALARQHSTGISSVAGSAWLDFSWSVYRPTWRAP